MRRGEELGEEKAHNQVDNKKDDELLDRSKRNPFPDVMVFVMANLMSKNSCYFINIHIVH